MTTKKAEILQKNARPRASKKVKKPENPFSLFERFNLVQRRTLWRPRRPRSKKKFTAPKAEILQKNAETENLQKSAKTAQKAAPAKKAENSMLPLSKIQPRPTELNMVRFFLISRYMYQNRYVLQS